MCARGFLRIPRTLGVVIVVGVAIGAADSTAADQATKRSESPPRGAYEITDLQAFLLYDRTGRVGERNVAEPFPEGASDDRGTPRDLYHAMSGEETEDGPSNFTMVIATLRKPSFLSHRATGHLKLTGTNKDGRVLFSETRPLGRTGSAFANPEHKVPFLIPWTGCVPVILQARLDVRDGGFASKAILKRVVPFLCHE